MRSPRRAPARPVSPRAAGVLALLLAPAAVACGGSYGGGPKGATTTPRATAPAGGLDKAALPYAIVDARTGRAVEAPAFWAALGQARAVCVGEDHDNPHHHWVQLEVVRQLIAQGGGGARLAVGLEMVQRPFQGVLDDYAANKIDAATLQSRTGWEERWGYDFGFYGPTMDAVARAGGALLALNAPRELTKKVVRQGLEALTAEERAQVPELVLDDKTHRAWFDDLMAGMGGAHGHGATHGAPAGADAATPADAKPAPPAPADAAKGEAPHAAGAMPSAERVYTVQVIWDESMADGTARWLAADPARRAVILAGNGHCHESAVVRRLERRGVGDVVSVRPVLDVGTEVADVLARPVNDYAVVLQIPKAAQGDGPVHGAK